MKTSPSRVIYIFCYRRRKTACSVLSCEAAEPRLKARVESMQFEMLKRLFECEICPKKCNFFLKRTSKVELEDFVFDVFHNFTQLNTSRIPRMHTQVLNLVRPCLTAGRSVICSIYIDILIVEYILIISTSIIIIL